MAVSSSPSAPLNAIPSKTAHNAERGWYSEGWIAWVGTYEDLKNNMEGQYRLKLAHTYLDDQTQPQITAGADTGYCGNVVLDDGTIVTSSYGKFDPDKTYIDDAGNTVIKTSIISKRIDLSLTDRLAGSKN